MDIQNRIEPALLEIESNQFYEADVLSNHSVFDRRYDVSFAIDAIEHFKKEDGYRLLRKMENISETQVLFTPLGEMWIDEDRELCYDSHKSGWLPSDVPEYDCIVLNGFHGEGDSAFIFWKTSNPDSHFSVVEKRINKIC